MLTARIIPCLDVNCGRVVKGVNFVNLRDAGDPVEVARRFEDAGVAAIIYTDVARDGMLQGINWDATIALAEAISIPVVASGGLASIKDIERMTQPDAHKLEGAIAGRALYDGRLDPAQAIALLRSARAA